MNPTQKKILVAVDGSEYSLEAVWYAGEILNKQNTEVVLFHVLWSVNESFWSIKKKPFLQQSFDYAREWEERQRKQAEEFMERGRQILMEAGFPESSIALKFVRPKLDTVREIAYEADKGYSAVVVGRRGHSRLKDMILGNTAHQLVQILLNVPVWVVGKPPVSKRVLLALDASEVSLKVAGYAAKMLAGTDAEILLLHVIKTMYYLSRGDVVSIEHAEWLNAIKEEIQPVFEEAKKRLTDAGIDSSRIHVKMMSESFSHAGGIIEEAKKGNYGTIVVGRQGHSRIEEFLLGRVSNKVIQMAGDYAVWVVG